MLTAYALTDHGLKMLDPSEDGTVPAEAGWIDLFRPTEAEHAAASEFLGADVPTRKVTEQIEFSSRYYAEEGTVYLTISALAGVDIGRPTISPFTFVIGPTKVATVRYEDSHSFRQFMARAEKPTGGCTDAPRLFVMLLEAFVERVADVLEILTLEADRIHQEIFSDRDSSRRRGRELRLLINQIGKQGDVVAKARECLASLERLIQFGSATLEDGYAKGTTRTRLKLVARDIRSIEEHMTFLDNKITFLLDATLGLISTEQNDVIRLLTVAATIFFPPTLIGTIYGMNFLAMPELNWTLGYPLALAAMVLSALLPYLYFRGRGWL